jgi:uncharacterized protein YggE
MKHATLAACLLALALGALPHPASAADPTTLTVNGQGSVSRTPDTALVDVALVTNDEGSAAKATDLNNVAYNSLLTRLRALGVRDDAVRTVGLNVHFVPRPQALRQTLSGPALPPQPQPRYGYVATRTLTVTAPRVDAAGRVVDAAVAVGANVNGVRFTLADQHAAVAAALAAAVADAQSQAESVASAAHLHVTGIKSIDVSGAPSPVMFAMREAAPATPTEIAPAALDVRASVGITYYVAP